jgi:predicted ATPase
MKFLFVIFDAQLFLMILKSIAFKTHAIFPFTKINFMGKSISYDAAQVAGWKSVTIEFDFRQKANHYTYIIGENGSGKTILFRSLIAALNRENLERDPAIDRWDNYAGKAPGSTNRRMAKRQAQNLFDLGIDIFGIEYLEDTLKQHQMQLIYISATLESGLVDTNPRYRSFNYFSDINKTKFLCLRVVAKHGYGHFRVLDTLLNDGRPIEWKFTMHLVHGDAENSVTGSPVVDISESGIIDLIHLLKKLSAKREKPELNERELIAFDRMTRDGFFFKMLYDSGKEPAEFFTLLYETPVIRAIRQYIRDETIAKLDTIFEPEIGTDFIFEEMENLSEIDVLLMGLMENQRMIHLQLQMDGVPIERRSSGEQTLIRLCSFFADMPIADHPKNLLVLFDEPENSLHPKWQHNFPAMLRAIVKAYGVERSHFIIATHSPLLLMKAVERDEEDTNLMRMFREKKAFKSEQVTDIRTFSYEELLVDEFKVAYKEHDGDREMTKKLLKEYQKTLGDPADILDKLSGFHQRVADLYNQNMKG